jgi:hypothetical protein
MTKLDRHMDDVPGEVARCGIDAGIDRQNILALLASHLLPWRQSPFEDQTSANRHRIGVVHVEYANGGPPGWGKSQDPRPTPLEMIRPGLAAGMEEVDDLLAHWVNTGEIRTFIRVALYTGECKIVILSLATVLLGGDVIHRKREAERHLGHLAVFTCLACSLPDSLLKGELHAA